MDLAAQKKLYTEEEYYELELPVRTELIDWKVYYLAAPSVRHQRIVSKINSKIGSFIEKNKGKCEVFIAPVDVKLRDGVIVQPDILVTCDPSRFDEQKHNGAPEWVIEIISPSTSVHDYNDKFWRYKEAGVREYWIVDPLEEKVLVYIFGENETFKTYSFSDKITAELYSKAEEPLVLCIAELEGKI